MQCNLNTLLLSHGGNRSGGNFRGKSSESVQCTMLQACDAQTWACYSALYRFRRLSIFALLTYMGKEKMHKKIKLTLTLTLLLTLNPQSTKLHSESNWIRYLNIDTKCQLSSGQKSLAGAGWANLLNRYSTLCWRPVTHAQTWASYSALYRFGRLSAGCMDSL